MNEATGRPPAADMAALASLNDSQRNAAQRSLARRVLPIQGPPGTGKTQVADAIFRIWKSIGVQGAAVGATPSNVAADNLARRLLKTATLDVKRYGPLATSTMRTREESLPRKWPSQLTGTRRAIAKNEEAAEAMGEPSICQGH